MGADIQFMDVEEEFSKCEDKVRWVLKRYEQARNDDDFLIWFIKHHVEDKDLNSFAEYKQTTNSETIRRSRQHIQNDLGEYLPTNPEVIEKRQLKEKQVREYFMSKGDKDTLRAYEQYLRRND